MKEECVSCGGELVDASQDTDFGGVPPYKWGCLDCGDGFFECPECDGQALRVIDAEWCLECDYSFGMLDARSPFDDDSIE